VLAVAAVHARESVMRVTAFEKPLDHALLDVPLQPPLGSQLLRMLQGALIKRTCPGVACTVLPGGGSVCTGTIHGLLPRNSDACPARQRHPRSAKLPSFVPIRRRRTHSHGPSNAAARTGAAPDKRGAAPFVTAGNRAAYKCKLLHSPR